MTGDKQANIWPQDEELNPWLDRSDAVSLIEKGQAAGEFDAETAQKLRQWHEQGVVRLSSLIEPEKLDRLLEAFEECYRTGRELAVDGYLQPLKRNDYGHLGTVTGAFMELAEYRDVFLHSRIVEWAKLLLGKDVYGAHSVFFFTGSEQPIHHDHVHETTRPFGYHLGVAIALEDILPGSGEFIYYPGSHRLGYINAGEVATRAGVENPQMLVEQAVLSSMQDKHIHSADWFKEYGIICNLPISELWSEKTGPANLPLKSFLAKKGDVLFFHTNLAHGGSAIGDPHLSRKSMVGKFVAKEVDFYHEIAPNYKHDRIELAEHNGNSYIVEGRAILPSKGLITGVSDLKDFEITRLKSELASMQQWAEDTQAQSQQALASLTEHLQRKEQELVKAQAWIAEKEAESQQAMAAYRTALKSKETELATLHETLRKKEKFYAEAIAAYEARRPTPEANGIYHPAPPEL